MMFYIPKNSYGLVYAVVGGSVLLRQVFFYFPASFCCLITAAVIPAEHSLQRKHFQILHGDSYKTKLQRKDQNFIVLKMIS